MKIFYSLLLCLVSISFTGLAQSGDGHTPTTTLSYVPAGYTTAPTMRQNVASTSASSVITAGSATDIFVNFTFDTSGKSVFLVYTTNGTDPTKTNGTVVNGSFSNFSNPNRTWVTQIPASVNVASTTVKYVLYISDSNLASGFARISANGQAGYQTSWTEGGQSFSYIVNTALPVILASFNAKANGRMANLDWATASEANNAYFDVERSADATSFTSLGRVVGRGTTPARQTYSFTDEAPADGANYYRLKQVDTDGTFSYSPVRVAVIRNNGELTILGNPVSTELNVSGLVAGSTAELLDMSGQVRHRQAVTADQMQVNVRNFASGTYLLRVTEPTGTSTKRVLISQ